MSRAKKDPWGVGLRGTSWERPRRNVEGRSNQRHLRRGNRPSKEWQALRGSPKIWPRCRCGRGQDAAVWRC